MVWDTEFFSQSLMQLYLLMVQEYMLLLLISVPFTFYTINQKLETWNLKTNYLNFDLTISAISVAF
jgi:hypothetical protein